MFHSISKIVWYLGSVFSSNHRLAHHEVVFGHHEEVLVHHEEVLAYHEEVLAYQEEIEDCVLPLPRHLVQQYMEVHERDCVVQVHRLLSLHKDVVQLELD